MIIFPAIDIRGGRCVRLVQGRADQETVYGDDPAAMGLRWQDAGAAWLHAYMDEGLDRLILGTAILKDPDLVARALTAHPGRIALGLDAKNGLLAVEGWTETTSRTAAEVALDLAPLKPAAIIYTDISRDGVKRGVNLEATGALAQATDIPVIASGGVSSIDDIKALLPLEPLGVIGVITGKALYDGNLDLKEAIRVAQGN
jgi:phosphoribosylformimino-5-aminoimidazole carboxamide ribotide isomerase